MPAGEWKPWSYSVICLGRGRQGKSCFHLLDTLFLFIVKWRDDFQVFLSALLIVCLWLSHSYSNKYLLSPPCWNESGFEGLGFAIQLLWKGFSLVVFAGILNAVFSMQLCHCLMWQRPMPSGLGCFFKVQLDFFPSFFFPYFGAGCHFDCGQRKALFS